MLTSSIFPPKWLLLNKTAIVCFENKVFAKNLV